MNTIGERIKAFRQKLGVNQKEFSERCAKLDNRERAKWGQSRIGNYEINNREPNLEDIRIMATVLGIEPAELAYGDDSEMEYAGRPKEGLIRVLGEARMGADGGFDMTEELMGFIQIYSSDPDAYCLRVKGNSMEPRILSGEFVVIEPNAVYYPGDEVFVRTVEGRNMIKIMDYCRDGEYRFSSINKAHDSFTLDFDEVETVSSVAAIVKRSRFISLDDVQDGAFG